MPPQKPVTNPQVMQDEYETYETEAAMETEKGPGYSLKGETRATSR